MEVLKERYSITELSEMLQLSDHTLRFYEKECELNIRKMKGAGVTIPPTLPIPCTGSS